MIPVGSAPVRTSEAMSFVCRAAAAAAAAERNTQQLSRATVPHDMFAMHALCIRHDAARPDKRSRSTELVVFATVAY